MIEVLKQALDAPSTLIDMVEAKLKEKNNA